MLPISSRRKMTLSQTQNLYIASPTARVPASNLNTIIMLVHLLIMMENMYMKNYNVTDYMKDATLV
jgi:hypothetical protein